MSLVDVDTWVNEFAACDRLSSDIQQQIVQRKAQPTASAEFARLSGTIRLRLKQFATELRQLSQKINTSGVQLTYAEVERRSRQCETLESKLTHLQTQFADANEQHVRAQLLQNAAPSLWNSAPTTYAATTDEDDEDVVSYNAALNGRHTTTAASSALDRMNVNELRQQQDRMLEHQDEGLDALAQIISRQKHLALRIGNEVDEQNDIIDDLAGDVERVDMRINNETRHVRTVSSLESSTCGYWVVIVCLFVAIVIVAAL